MQKTKKIIACSILLAVFSITGCMSTAMTGAQAVYNRHSLQKSLNDQYITMQANRKIYLDTDKFKDTNIAIATFNKVVLLAGQASPTQREEVDGIVKSIEGIQEIHNLITISKPTSTLTQMSDAWITAKIKTKFITRNDLDPNLIKVVTENGTVYLMGTVPPEQANVAVYIARTTYGVQSVVKIFSYLHVNKSQV